MSQALSLSFRVAHALNLSDFLLQAPPEMLQLFKEHCWPKRREVSDTDVLQEQCFRANWNFLTRALGFLFQRYSKSVNNLHMPLAWCQMLAARLVEFSEAVGKKMYPDLFSMFLGFCFDFVYCYFFLCSWEAKKRIGPYEGYKRTPAWSIIPYLL